VSSTKLTKVQDPPPQKKKEAEDGEDDFDIDAI